MNDREKLQEAIECYLESDLKMDFMTAFSTLSASEDSSVRCVSEFLIDLVGYEYPEFRFEKSVHAFLQEIRKKLLNGEAVDEADLSSLIHNNVELQNLLEQGNKEVRAGGWFAVALVVVLLAIAVCLLIF